MSPGGRGGGETCTEAAAHRAAQSLADREQRAQSPTGGTGLGELQVTQAEARGHGLTFFLSSKCKGKLSKGSEQGGSVL